MKVVCLIFSLLLQPDGTILQEQTERSMESIEECLAWKYQQEFQAPVQPHVADWYVCIEYMEV